MSVTFSLIVPIFNDSKRIERLIRSLQPQVGNFEVLFEDDGSTDDSESIFRLLVGTDSRFHWECHTHTGRPGAMRNSGMRQAINDYLIPESVKEMNKKGA
ncbi:MAG: glycosyltransferase family A protein [Victivallaceae bacterium]|nr:glycosyltransferase family A protein [Victivallaceae bacterium]